MHDLSLTYFPNYMHSKILCLKYTKHTDMCLTSIYFDVQFVCVCVCVEGGGGGGAIQTS